MFTSTAPIRAEANCVKTHSGPFIDQIPTWSPGLNPKSRKAEATRSTRSSNADQE